MEFKNIKELINIVDSSDLAFFEIKTLDTYIKMDKSLTRGLGENTNERISVNQETNIETEKINKQEEKKIDEVKEENLTKTTKDNEIDEDLMIITSPMVGTFYSSPSPESPAFAQKGENIKKGQVICIIEAMKLMNEIESECSGKIINCLVKDGDMVEYGQKLFEIKGE